MWPKRIERLVLLSPFGLWARPTVRLQISFARPYATIDRILWEERRAVRRHGRSRETFRMIRSKKKKR